MEDRTNMVKCVQCPNHLPLFGPVDLLPPELSSAASMKLSVADG